MNQTTNGLRNKAFRGVSFFAGASALAFGCLDFGDLSGAASPCTDCEAGVADGSFDEASAPGFSLTVDPTAPILQGASAPITVTITRNGGFSEAVNVTVSGLPAGATSNPLTLTGAAPSGTLTLSIAPITPQSLSHLSIDGVSTDGKVSASAKLDVIVRGPPGSLDELFGDHGIATNFSTGFLVGTSAMALDATGNILIVGQNGYAQFSNFAMARVNSSGIVDKTFGTGGVLQQTFYPKGNFFSGVFPLADGSALAGGSIGLGYGNVFTKVTSAGAIDPTYAADGGLGGNFLSGTGGSGSNGTFARFVMVPGGGLIGVGDYGGGPFPVATAARYDVNGVADPAFSPHAYAVGSGGSYAVDVALEADGKAVMLVYATADSYTGLGLLRVTTSGDRDMTFAASGQAAFVPPNILTQAQQANSLVIQPDKKVIALGSTASGGILARYVDPSGTLDNGFGSDGVAAIPDTATFALAADGKILLASTASVPIDGGTYSVFSIGRLTSGGLVDPTFGTSGFTQTQIGTKTVDGGAFGYAILIQPDGKILVGGRVSTSQDTSDFAVARYWP